MGLITSTDTMRKLWTGRVELLTPQTEWGDTKCFTNVFLWAESATDFANSIKRHLEAESISVLRIEECHQIEVDEEIPDQTKPFFEWAKNHPEEFTTTDRHYFPSKPA